jgi:hypothetical protein
MVFIDEQIKPTTTTTKAATAPTQLSGYIARITAIIKQLTEKKDKVQAMSRLTTLKQEILATKQPPPA